MQPWWKTVGLEEAGGRRANAMVDRMVALVVEIGSEPLAKATLAEALFRVFELPKRAPPFQTEYKRANRIP